MDTKKKEEAPSLSTEQKNLLNTVNDTVLDARTVVQDVLIQDKKDGRLLNKLQDELAQVIDFLSD